MREILRLRQRHSRVDTYLPWREVYFVPDEQLEHVYTMMGHAISYKWSPTTADTGWLRLFKSNLGDKRLLMLQGYSVVVPFTLVPSTRQTKGIAPHRRVLKKESSSQMDYLERTKPHLLEELRRNVPAASVALHFDTGPEGMESLCANCVNTQSHLMGLCTPGLTRCSYGVVVPAAERLIHVRKKGTLE